MCYQNKKNKNEYNASYLFIYTVRPQALRQTQHTNKKKKRKKERKKEKDRRS